MTKIGLLSCLFLTCSLWSSEFINTAPLKLSRYNNGYSLHNDKAALHFPNHQVSKSIRDLREDQLAALLKSNAYYLKATQLSDGSHALDLQGRLPGAGLGGIALGRYIGNEGSKMVFIVCSVSCLLLAQGAIHVFQGPTAGAAFKAEITNRFMPHVEEIAEKFVGPVFGVMGGGAAALATPF